MCKKLVLAVGAVIVGLLVISFTGVSSLLTVKWNETRGWMQRQVPLETQIETLKVDASKIDGDIKKNLGKLAAQEVEVDRLEANVLAMKDKQASTKADIAAMSKALDSKETKVAYNGRTYRQSDLTLKLESALNTYEISKAEIKTKEQVLAQKRQALDLSHQRISDMRTKKEQLRVSIADLERRIEALKLKQIDSPVDVDNSAVSRCNALVDQLNKEIAVQEKEADLLHQYGYDKEREKYNVRENKTREDVLQAAKKALQDDDEDVKVSDKK
jgi:hypothetical protein